MRVALIGSKSLSVYMLHALINQGHEVLAVYTRDDESSMKIWQEQLGHPSLKNKAENLNIPVYESMKVNSDESLRLLESLNLDVIFSCFWSEIFKEPILNIPRLGVFNMHTAFLPKNRGSRPIPWSIINGESHTGITLHKMMTGVDNGPIVAQKLVPIKPSDTAESLYNKVIEAGQSLFEQNLHSFSTGQYTLTLQPELEATYQPRGEPYGGQINPYWDPEKQSKFKAAFTFKPFRAWRNWPSSDQKKLLITFVKHDDTLEANALHSELKSCQTNSIGNPALRIKLTRIIENSKRVVIKNLQQPADLLYPLHDVALQRKLSGLSLKSIKNLTPCEATQPHRYKNGLLEIPHFEVTNLPQALSAIHKAKKNLAKAESFFVLNLLLGDFTEIEKNQLSQEIEKIGAQELTFEQVCQLFDTEYETLGT